MRLRFLGTAASEGFPDAFCDCDNCARSRQAGGKSLRSRSAALVDDVLLIDLGPDLMTQARVHGISLARIEHCIQTHEHADHLDYTNFLHRSPYCGVHGNPRLNYWATKGALAVAATGLGRRAPNGLPDPEVEEQLNIAVHPIEPFARYKVGPYQVSTVKGFHDPERVTPLLHVIERDGRALFYATDTGEIPEDSWRALVAGGHRFDVVAMDHTFGFQKRSTGHMNAEQFGEQVARMRAEGMLKDGARVYAHHVAHHSHPPHEELEAWTRARGYEVAYDGLVVEL